MILKFQVFFLIDLFCASRLGVRISMGLSESGLDCTTAFWAFALMTAIGGLFFVFIPTPPPRKNDSKDGDDDNEDGEGTRNGIRSNKGCCCCSLHTSIILVTGALLGLYVGAETGYGGFVMLYAREQFEMPESSGTHMTAVLLSGW